MKKIKLLISAALLVALGLLSISCSSEATSATKNGETEQNAGIAKNISVKEFSTGIQKADSIILLDVRTPGEIEKGYINGSINIDFSDPEFLDNLEKLDKGRPIYVYCHSGRRSETTMNSMRDMGFKEVYNLSGGIVAWAEEGLEIKQ